MKLEERYGFIFVPLLLLTFNCFCQGSSIRFGYTFGSGKYNAPSIDCTFGLSGTLSLGLSAMTSSSEGAPKSNLFGLNVSNEFTKKFTLSGGISWSPEVDNYKYTTGNIDFIFTIPYKALTSEIYLSLARTWHFSKIYRPRFNRYDWVVLGQTFNTIGLTATYKRMSVFCNLTGYRYTADLQKVELVATNFQLYGVLGVVSNFPKGSSSLGIGYDISQYFSLTASVTGVEFALGDYKTTSYILGVSFYPSERIQITTQYNPSYDKYNTKTEYYLMEVGYVF